MSQITVSPSQTQFSAEDSETILSAAIRQGINLPHSCQSGVCGSCAATVVSGDVVQSAEYDDYVLTEEEIAAGTVRRRWEGFVFHGLHIKISFTDNLL